MTDHSSGMYIIRKLRSSKQEGLVYWWLNLKPPILSLPGTFVDCSFHRKIVLPCGPPRVSMYDMVAGAILAVHWSFRGWLVEWCVRHICDRLAFMIENCEHDASNYRANSIYRSDTRRLAS